MTQDQLSGEEQRLQELFSYDILDSLSETEYDEIAQLASVICQTPVAIISFVDSDRQWFKSIIGVDALETPRVHSFCSHAIQSPQETFIIEDSRLDDRFKDNPLVTGDPGIVFYAGIPLVTSSGCGLGTVCVIDKQTRTLDEAQIGGLRILANQVMKLLELRKSNRELQLTGDILDRHLSERTREIANQNTELEKINRELQAFTYISSHDLQEPLRKIQTFTSWITEKEAFQLSEKGQEYLSKIGQASSRMSILLRDLLNYSRATTTEPVFAKTTLSAILDFVREDLQEEIEAKQARFQVNRDIELHIIPFQFRQLLYNLISNSLKFSKQDVQPLVVIESEYNMGTSFGIDALKPTAFYHRIALSDNGVGFESQYSEKIFELFQRLGTRQVQVGTGVGLAIVKKIVDNHNGHIKARGEQNKGATFEIYIPEIPILN